MKYILALFLLSACAHPVPISKPGDGLRDAHTAITHLKRSGTYFTPTLAFYSANVNLPPDSATRAGRHEAGRPSAWHVIARGDHMARESWSFRIRGQACCIGQCQEMAY